MTARATSHWRDIAVSALALVALAGCRTDNLGAYTQAIENRAPQEAAPDIGEEFRLSNLQPNQRPAPNTDEESLWFIIDRAESKMKTAGNRVDDARLTTYVKSVTCRVAGPHCKDIRSYVLRIPAFNATMYPNGMTTVWTGLLLRVRNEAQLAAVIGHETGHFLRRHSLQRMRDIIEQTNALVFIQFALAGAGAGSMNGVLSVLVNGGFAAFSRDNEREADGYGIVLAAEAGYDPREAAKIWQQLERERKANEDQIGPVPFFASHPPTVERAHMLALLGDKFASPKARDIGRERFLAAILPIRADLLRDEMHLRKYDSFSVLLDMLMEDGANLAELHYFKGEMHRLRQKEGDAKIALNSYNAAKTVEGSAPADIERSIALVHRQLGQNAEARAALQRYLDTNPKANDAAMIRQMLGDQ